MKDQNKKLAQEAVQLMNEDKDFAKDLLIALYQECKKEIKKLQKAKNYNGFVDFVVLSKHVFLRHKPEKISEYMIWLCNEKQMDLAKVLAGKIKKF